jgi:hypothetical protein
MRSLQTFLATCALALVVASAPLHVAKAGFILEGSVGYGYEVDPQHATQAINLMLTPGVEIADVLRLEVGILGAYGAVRSGLDKDLQLEFRPMVVLAPPVIPLYARLILSVVQPFSDADRTIAYGGALGIGVSVPASGVGVFLEVGILPRSVTSQVTQLSEYVWILEGRAGVSFEF